jgi:hypothetical protein
VTLLASVLGELKDALHIKTVPDLRGFAAATKVKAMTRSEMPLVINFPSTSITPIVCIGAFVSSGI